MILLIFFSKEGRARLENACLIGLKSKCVAMQGDLLIAFKLRKSEVNVLFVIMTFVIRKVVSLDGNTIHHVVV